MSYNENIRIIAEELERLKSRPTGDKLPEVEATDEGKVLTVDSSGKWVAANPSSSYDLDYSTTEKDTGMKWVDGRTIYAKTFTGIIPAVSSPITLVSGADTLVGSEGTYESGVDNWPFSFPLGGYSITAVKSSNTGIVLYNEIPSIVGNNFTVTVYYTKTTSTKKKGAK